MFAKTFIGSKTVFFEVEQFNFYVLTETEGDTSTMAGYFSKVHLCELIKNANLGNQTNCKQQFVVFAHFALVAT